MIIAVGKRVVFYLSQDWLEQSEADCIKLPSGFTTEITILAFPTMAILANATCTFLSHINRNLQLKKGLGKKKSIVFHDCLKLYDLAHWVG